MGLVVSENELADQIVPAEIQLIKKKNKKHICTHFFVHQSNRQLTSNVSNKLGSLQVNLQSWLNF